MESPLRTLTDIELKQKRQRGWDYITEVFEPSFGNPIPSKQGYRPQADPWRPRWPFPRGMGLNIPRFFTEKVKYNRVLIPIIKQRQRDYLTGTTIDFLPTMVVEFAACPYLKTKGLSRHKQRAPSSGAEICLNCPLDKCFYDKREGRKIKLRVAENCNQSYNKVTARVTFISNHK